MSSRDVERFRCIGVATTHHLIGSTTLRAVTADFQAAHHDVKTAFALDLAFETIEQVTFKFGNFAAAQTCHMNVVALRTALVKVLFTLHVHEVKFVNQSMPFKQFEGTIDGHAIDAGIDLAGLTQYLSGVQVELGSFDDAQDCSPLVGEAKASGRQFGLKISGNFGLWQWHNKLHR